MKIAVSEFSGEGMSRVYENDKWTVGVKNYKSANDIKNLDMLERHNETDELFVLLSGSCVLISAVEDGEGMAFEQVAMEPYKVYVIPKSLWHNTVTEKDTKMILIEDPGTGEANSDFYRLSEEEAAKIRAMVE